MQFLTGILLLSAGLVTGSLSSNTTTQSPPSLTFLYTAYVDCLPNIYTSYGPFGNRTTIPIVGGNFTGPRMSGRILDVGADWGLTDVQTGIFSADTRYNLQTDDGANIFIRTSGPSQPSGGLQLRILFETGDARYYWLNNVIAVGVLSPVSTTDDGFTLRIDAWHLDSELAAPRS
ncbi:hypothetical protein EJ05DRAFT_534626 [Pseudovirgaria hyperparasitica]|uniref:Uncharacterized protein n=1 Tax=Pseudovirgaria hyperparasitica TaxID=470096 RepID=A0A6A6WM17_9PEZI|nr:uncharacterized protein EJ05DRAFT_534626 [Pseudovirgaria hyperparasitica]KAF2763241.1 hypothetical protein EJ05DRAFT_534626 [Pseudovirgaria hyperparasitica]